MISRQDILERAREWQLRAEVVEKDYVLGWLLAAIAQDAEAGANWVLKGGTCVKKCFFETYRFSEDLDFTLVPLAGYAEAELLETLRRVATRAGELSGIAFSAEQVAIKARHDKLGRPTYEGRIGYQGPLRIPTWPRVLFDLTNNEPIVDEPVLRRVLHPYPDELPPDTLVRTYSFEELLAEKTRALGERSRPRDLYDVVYIIENASSGLALARAREIWEEKCRTKGFPPPPLADLIELVQRSGELRADWDVMLAHQLPRLPPIDGVIGRLGEALAWVERVVVQAAQPPAVPLRAQEELLTSPSVRLWGVGQPLEAIRFAGANRLLVEFEYSGSTRLVEPYSLRRAGTGNLLLYAWEVDTGQIKAFNVNKIVNPRATAHTFAPRFQVEFSAGRGLEASIPPAARRSTGVGWRSARARPRSGGPVYVFACPACGKEFRRKKNNSRLRRHTYPGSSAICSGRHGYLLRVQ